jgi:hypothetical protein
VDQAHRVAGGGIGELERGDIDEQQMQLLGIDSGRYPVPQDTHELVLSTGNRADLLVTTVAGASQLRALPYNRGIQDVIHGHRLGHRHSVTAAHLLDQPPTRRSEAEPHWRDLRLAEA